MQVAIGILIVGGFFLGTCAWMAFGDEDPRWVRGTVRNVLGIGGCFGALFVLVYALEGWGFI